MIASARKVSRTTAALFATVLAVGACSNRQDPPPAVDDTTGRVAGGAAAPANTGMSTRKKLVVLAGAAALYYMYKHHKTATEQTGENSQYYLSKNGRVYYRDADHRAHWVTPPPAGIQVPASEAADYERFQGYDNRTTGNDLTNLADDPE